MARFAFISQLDGGASRLQAAQQWRDQALLPGIAAIEGARGAHAYAAFNTTQLALVAQMDSEDAARAAMAIAPPAGMTHRGGFAELGWEMLQQGAPDPEDSPLLYSVCFRVPADWSDEFDRWYEQEHVPMIYGSRHWSMTRRYRFLDAAPDGPTHLALHYLSDARGFDAPQLKASRLTPWRNKFLTQRWFTDVEKMIYFRQTPVAPAR